jgi:hypothetical protein
VEETRLAELARQYKSIPIFLLPFSTSTFRPEEKFSRHCSQKAVMCAVGGMLGVVLVQQPSKLLRSYISPNRVILSTTIGHVQVPAPQSEDDFDRAIISDFVALPENGGMLLHTLGNTSHSIMLIIL